VPEAEEVEPEGEEGPEREAESAAEEIEGHTGAVWH